MVAARNWWTKYASSTICNTRTFFASITGTKPGTICGSFLSTVPGVTYSNFWKKTKNCLSRPAGNLHMSLSMGWVICTKMASSTVIWSRQTSWSTSTAISNTGTSDCPKKFQTWILLQKRKTLPTRDPSMEHRTTWHQSYFKRMESSRLLLISGRWDVCCTSSQLENPLFLQVAWKYWFKWFKSLKYRQFQDLAMNSTI